MCGRFTQSYTWEQLFALYQLGQPPANLRANWNVAPTQDVGVVSGGEAGLHYGEMKWGLIPFWAKDEKFGAKCINARAETAHEKPAFRAAFKARRCVIPASEWRSENSVKQPYFISASDGLPFSFAGLWESRGDGLVSCAILTTAANDAMLSLHDRMPVILAKEAVRPWIETGGPDLLKPCPSERLQMWPVDRRMGSPKVQGPQCIEPLSGQG